MGYSELFDDFLPAIADGPAFGESSDDSVAHVDDDALSGFDDYEYDEYYEDYEEEDKEKEVVVVEAKTKVIEPKDQATVQKRESGESSFII